MAARDGRAVSVTVWVARDADPGAAVDDVEEVAVLLDLLAALDVGTTEDLAELEAPLVPPQALMDMTANVVAPTATGMRNLMGSSIDQCFN